MKRLARAAEVWVYWQIVKDLIFIVLVSSVFLYLWTVLKAAGIVLLSI